MVHLFAFTIFNLTKTFQELLHCFNRKAVNLFRFVKSNMYASKYFYVFLILQPNVPFSFCSWQISFSNVTSSPCSGVRLETEKALESLKCSLPRRYLVLFSLWKALGFDYLGLLVFTSLLCSALVVSPPPSWKRGTVLRLDSFPFLFLYLSQG